MNKLLPVLLLLFVAACTNSGGGSDKPDDSVITTQSTGIPAPQNITYNIIGVYPHDTSAYTQGLQFHDGKLYEGTGEYEKSSLRITEIKTGNVLQKHMMGSSIDAGGVFGEGITIFKDKIYQLTWQSNIVYVYDLKNINAPIKTFKWPYEGWGITNNGTDLIISDGTSNIYFVNPEDFSVKTTRQVVDNQGPVIRLNELEYINGYVYANVYTADYIVKIDPNNGHVVGRMSMQGLIQQYAPNYSLDLNEKGEVLNGIAYDSTTQKVYITGKDWPKMFEMTINP
ncbi:glutaminyl-peptide cyclotransferase [Ferruginibacter sp. SUN002]|uniref:glutaminyl-peptide cyclotransferase n=1 Tax=Ferruginibacter sp. SUN002 TaxID=2937789 RepID=UPI003D3688A2